MNVYVALSLNFKDNIIRKIRMAYYMSRGQRHKSAISITLDDKVLAFFSGKGRSGRINYVLTQYLRWNLGQETQIGFDETTPLHRVTSARSAVQKEFGDDSIEVKLIDIVRERMRNE